MFSFKISRPWVLMFGLTAFFSIQPSIGRSIDVRHSDSLQWGPCVKALEWGEPSSLVCAEFTVPLDWTNPSNGKKAVMYVVKLKAKSRNPLGTIFANPGGPGGSGLDFLSNASSEQLSDITGGNFDIVSWDPRGVGYTRPAINCFHAKGNQTANEVMQDFHINLLQNSLNARSNGPDQSDTDAFLGNSTTLGTYVKGIMKECVNKNQDNLKYVGTVSTVKDLADAIQGPNSPINYWGFS
ncbi:hypothetical protein FRC02_011929 [Tulasnella sp. 418]|nr:hypothetical protein FRC02_011929 [Tulasnella sp. 418]